MALLIAVVHRDLTGIGQFIDVNMHAGSNVTTEAGSYEWLVANDTVQRQTGRHAGVNASMPSQVRCTDGVYVNTGFPPRNPAQFQLVYDWLEQEGLIEKLAEAPILLAAAQGEPFLLTRIAQDPEAQAKFAAGREAMNVLAANLTGYEFFTGGQSRGFQLGIIYAPEDVMEDVHFKERGFVVDVEHPEVGESFRYPGAPYRFEKSPWQLTRRAPQLGEDNSEVYGALGLSEADIDALRSAGVI
jgi:crotonobetainyl-CoA:carnitine CoA-transferase CaiB-like acyl-CoA transferase